MMKGDSAFRWQRVEMPTRTIEIYSIEQISYSKPELQIRTHVSSGTYIRTLAEDIGKATRILAICAKITAIDKLLEA